MLIINENQIQGYTIDGNYGSDLYAGLLPLTHESGAAWWLVENTTGSPFVDSDGQPYLLRKRSFAELQATDEYKVWAHQHPDDPTMPKLWADIRLSSQWPDVPPGIQADGTDALTITVAIRAANAPDAPQVPGFSGKKWRITIRKIVSEYEPTVIDTDVKRFAFTSDTTPSEMQYTSKKPGVYLISETDFDKIKAGSQTYQVKLITPVMFKVWQA